MNPFATLSEATTLNSLRRVESLSVTLDHAYMGVGTKFHSLVASTLLPPERTQFQMRLRRYDTTEEMPAALSNRRFVLPKALK